MYGLNAHIAHVGICGHVCLQPRTDWLREQRTHHRAEQRARDLRPKGHVLARRTRPRQREQAAGKACGDEVSAAAWVDRERRFTALEALKCLFSRLAHDLWLGEFADEVKPFRRGASACA